MLDIIKNENGASEIIGNILMVAIVIALAAIIGIYVFEQANNVDKNKLPVFTAKRVDSSTIELLYHNAGGSSSVTNVIITSPNFDLSVAGNIYSLNSNPYNPYTNNNPIIVGNVLTARWSTPLDTNVHLTVKAKVDGKEQLVLIKDM